MSYRMLTRLVGIITNYYISEILYVYHIKAIEFAMEEGDEDLWELLITLSIGKPSMDLVFINDTCALGVSRAHSALLGAYCLT